MKKLFPDTIRPFFEALFESVIVPRKIYLPVINGLIETSLRGIDSHGIRLIPHYINAVKIGRINPCPEFKITNTSATTRTLDADHGYGIAASTTAMNEAIATASKYGMGAVSVFNSSHFSSASIYTLVAARKNMIGICMSNVEALVLPYGGKEPMLGTNPISFAAPLEGEDPFCLDMATSQISWNKFRMLKREGTLFPPGATACKAGEPVLDPEKAEFLLPFGGYKGYGIMIVVEMFTSILSGMPYGTQTTSMYPLNPDKRNLGHFLMAIDIARFVDPAYFQSYFRKFLDELRTTPPAAGTDKVLVSNDPEKAIYKERIVSGIPVSENEWNELHKIANEQKVTLPSNI